MRVKKMEMRVKEMKRFEDVVSNNPPFVDLGLSVKWCNYNVGGKSAGEGMCLAWGEAEEKEEYSPNTCDYDKSFEDVKYGVGRMPTIQEYKELEKLDHVWGKYGNVNGMYFIGLNGNVIFLPAEGYCLDTEANDVGTSGYYWSSTYLDSSNAYYFYFSSDAGRSDGNDRCYGQSVRLVQD